MLRPTLRTTLLFAVLSAYSLPSVHAQNTNAVRYGEPVPILPRATAQPTYAAPRVTTPPAPIMRNVALRQPGQTVIIEPQPSHDNQRIVPAYPYLNAPMYTSPRQNIPHQVGAAVYTNQAFAPHEMLHEHTYKAMYPPYYHKVNGHWVVTPWGVWSAENWELQGTEVTVKYRRHKPPFNLFTKPWLH